MFGWARGGKIGWGTYVDRRLGPARRRGRFWLLLLFVVAWWLTIAAIVVATLPGSVDSAPRSGFVAVSGQTARINQHGLRSLPIPVSRAAFDQLRRAYRESDQDAIERAFASTEWLGVSHGQAVRVEVVDGDAVQVTLLEGEGAGQRGWILTRQLLH